MRNHFILEDSGSNDSVEGKNDGAMSAMEKRAIYLDISGSCFIAIPSFRSASQPNSPAIHSATCHFIMKTGLLFKLAFLVALLLATSADGFFFEYPKKSIWEFFQWWKEKKEAKKKPQTPNIRHYHVHYYPTKIHVISAVSAKAPNKYELDTIHNEKLASLGWSDYEYKYAPEPKVGISSLHGYWNGLKSSLSGWGPGYIETDLTETLDRSEHEGILVQLPVHHQIIVEHPRSSQKASVFATFFHKSGPSK